MVTALRPETKKLDLKHINVGLNGISDQETLIVGQLNEFGYSIVQCPPFNPRQDLLNLQPLLGKIVNHPLSDGDGIVSVNHDPTRPNYVNKGKEYLRPHSDGGMKPNPPKILCLQCIQSANHEGLTILVRGDEIYSYLRQKNPSDLPLLFEPDVLSISRTEQTAQHPIFSINEAGNIQMVYRADSMADITVKPAAQKIFGQMLQFVEDPANQTRFALLPYQVLICDNTRVLHGRTAFDPKSKRLLNRLWFDGMNTALNLGFTP
jgi:alpha-ketoglutarate-dependent taurine dioxygenase